MTDTATAKTALPDAPRHRRRLPRARWLLLAAVVLAVALPFLYVKVIVGAQPAPLTLPPPASAGAATPSGAATATAMASSTATAPAGLNGAWVVAAGSRAGYRVRETVVGQTAEVVGRTDKVTGEATVAGDSLTAASFTVDVESIASDDSARDTSFNYRIMDVTTYPTASFALTEPIVIPQAALAGDQFTAKATGTFTMHGTTKPVTFPVTARKSAKGFDVTGQIVVRHADYGIADPSVVDVVKVAKTGIVEVLLTFVKKAG